MKRSRNLMIGSAALALLTVLAFATASCRGVRPLVNAGTRVAVGTGNLDPEQAASIRRGAGAVISATEAFSPEEEHFIGRAVAATVLAQYPALDNPELNAYLNTLGQTLALFSDRPETFGGYRFLALDSDEINAFAAPGGFILVARGMIRAASDEGMLAAILAHEIAHVQNGHGLRAIRGSRITSAVTILASESARHLSGGDLAKLTGVFEDSIGDIGAALISNGYSRSYESEADRDAIAILARAGYSPQALIAMLEQIQLHQQSQRRQAGWARTHPPPADRIKSVRKLMPSAPYPTASPYRQDRFAAATAGL